MRALVTPIERTERSGKVKKDPIPHNAVCFLCLARELGLQKIDLTCVPIAMLSGEQPTLLLARILAECVFQPALSASNSSHHLTMHLEAGITDATNVVEREYHAFKEGQGAGGQTAKVGTSSRTTRCGSLIRPLSSRTGSLASAGSRT